MLTDLDQCPCASALITDWMGNVRRHHKLLLRVAVREVEAWLLADPQPLANFLNVSASRIPTAPDQLPDPKRTLVQLARRSRTRSIRMDIAPAEGSTATQGPNYNGALRPFVENEWNPQQARISSPSLDRAIRAIYALHTVYPAWN